MSSTTPQIMKNEPTNFVSRRTYNVSRSNIVSSRSKVIKEYQKTLYHIHANAPLLKSSSTLTIRQNNNTKGPVVASAVLHSRQDDFEVFLGDAHSSDASAKSVQADGEPLDRYFEFDVGSQPYAWQRTFNHSTRIQIADGTVEETMGNDWRLIALEGSTPGGRDRALAAYIQQNKPTGTADIHWFEEISDEVEWSSLAVIMGVLEQRRRSEKEWRSGTSLLLS